MAAFFQISNLGKVFNTPLFSGVNLTANEPVKIGLIGDNGSGKSTFLKMLARIYPINSSLHCKSFGIYSPTLVCDANSSMTTMEPVEQGEIIYSPDCRIGYLEQEIYPSYWDLQNGMKPRWVYIQRTGFANLSTLTITSDTFEVSGGEKKILKISDVFYGNYNVLFLDEPDNHLDLKTVIGLERFLKEYTGTLILVSHDKTLIDATAETIYVLKHGKLTRLIERPEETLPMT